MRSKLALAVGTLIVLVGLTAKAQTVTNLQTTNTTLGFGTKLAAVACNAAAASRWTGWIKVSTQGRVTFDVDLVDANSDETSLDMRCETSTVTSTVADAGRDLPVIVATAATGVSTMTVATWSWVATGGGAPGTSKYTITIENIPAPVMECLFTCQGAAAAADNFTVFARGINP